MADDPFESDVEALFAEAPAFDDDDAFAQAVERRLELADAPAGSPRTRWSLIGVAAILGGAIALKSVQAIAGQAAPALDQAQAAASRLSDALSDVAAGATSSDLWMAAGLVAAALVTVFVAQEI